MGTLHKLWNYKGIRKCEYHSLKRLNSKYYYYYYYYYYNYYHHHHHYYYYIVTNSIDIVHVQFIHLKISPSKF